MPSLLARIHRRAVYSGFPLIFRPDVHRADLVRLGTDYGGWWVPRDLIDGSSVCYLGGVGTDISFDLALIDVFGCQVWGIDPTPVSIGWLAEQELPEEYHFLAVGLSGEAGTLKFFLPKNPGDVSASSKNIQRTQEYFEAPVQTIAQTMEQLGHSRLDLVKLDIEGAEHDTIRQMLADGIRPRVVCVEYDHPEPIHWSIRTTRLLRRHGYRLARIEYLNLTFVLDAP